MPLANDFREPHEEHAGFAPLKVLFCPRCSLAQLSVVVKPEILYSHYSYVTSPSQTMQEHFHRLVEDILTEQTPGSAVEIGSNDGLFLDFLSSHGFGNLVGIDPAKNLAKLAHEAGLITINDFFGVTAAKAALQAAGEVGLVIARHVFCHIDNWHGFMEALDVLATRETLICIEVPYVVDQLSQGSFDQVYHEHLSYLTIKSLKALTRNTPFHLHRICHYPIHGGTIVVMLRRNNSQTPPHPSVLQYLEKEDVTVETWQKFAAEADLQIMQLSAKVRDLASEGKRICGYGASAKSTVWVNACNFTRKQIQFICDSTAEKVFCTAPGTDIPIVHEGEHFVQCMDYAILFAWNYGAEIIEREARFKAGGGHWIVPVPKLQIV